MLSRLSRAFRACALVTSGIALAGAPALASVPAEPPPARVYIRIPMKGVDLYSAKGIASFYRRLERAAKRACDYGNIPGYYDKECAADALERAVWGRGVRALVVLHEERTNGGRPRRDVEVVRFVCTSDRPLEFC